MMCCKLDPIGHTHAPRERRGGDGRAAHHIPFKDCIAFRRSGRRASDGGQGFFYYIVNS